jgi:biotin transport system substrate-specific component
MTFARPRLQRVPVAERGITIADFLVPVRLSERMGVRLRHAILVLVAAMVIYLSARVAFPIPGTPVPVTGQTFGVLLVGGALGLRRGVAATLLYVLLGVVGLPFFAEGHAGLATVLGSTGGYLVGFVLAGAIVGRLAELGWDRRLGGSIAAMLIGNLAIYVIGVPWLMVVTGATPAQAIEQGLTPFLRGDALKIGLAALLFPAAWWVVGRRPDEA